MAKAKLTETEVFISEPTVLEKLKHDVRMSVLFHEKKFRLIQELQPQMETNAAWVKNMFPKRIADLIKDMQGDIRFETRIGNNGPFEFGRIVFPDGTEANLPTLRSLEQTVQKNEWAHSIQHHLRKEVE